MLKHSAEIINGLLSDFLEVRILDTSVKLSDSTKSSSVLVLRFPIDPRTHFLDVNCFTCYKAKELAVQYITKELFWLYNFVLEFRDWKEHLAEYDDFCSNRL